MRALYFKAFGYLKFDFLISCVLVINSTVFLILLHPKGAGGLRLGA